MKYDDPLIDAQQLSRSLHDPRLRLIDCRFALADPAAGRRAYAANHLPGAVHADLDSDLSAPVTPHSGRHPLPTADALQATLRRLGLGRDSDVVVYDDRDGMHAARLWWMLRWAGHDAVRVLDGGIARWQALGLPADAVVPVVEPGDWVAAPRPALHVDAKQLAAHAADPDWRVLDARAAERYRGDVEPIDAVAGHVPGAVNQPFMRSLAADGRMLGAAQLRAELGPALGAVPSSRTVAMCGSGVTACHLLLALERAGLRDARLYAGSWSEWIRDPRRPVARGAEP